jgi:NAD(P)H dehydrogenase (quinone)
MCFPSKRQRDNFVETKESATDQNPPPAASTSQPSSPPAPATQTQTADTMSSPKVAIVIYSMYGHVAKRMFIIPSTP